VNVTGILSAIVSHAYTLGYFDQVNQHEPKNKNPAMAGITAAVWVQSVAPVKSSGLAATSGRLEFTVRIYTSMLAEPQDAIDPGVLTALDALMAAYSANFTLGGLVRKVDLLGEAGTPLSAQAGYLNQAGKLYRVIDITLPLIVNDIWAQEA
jgi:hypothetical protein